MPKPPKPEALNVEDLGDLGRYTDAELQQLREKLIANEARIHQESAHLQRRIKEINIARSELQHELGENARSMRAVKHAISQNARADFARPTHSAKPTRRRPGALRADL